jgi:5-methylcytosine-specific restriction endonuclease McrA
MSEKRHFKMPTPSEVRRPYQPEGGRPNWKTEANLWADRLRSTKRWRDLRERVLSARPKCELCERAAEEVHHIDPRDPSIFFAVENMAPLCHECHERINHAMKRRIDQRVFFPDETRLTLADITTEA